ncbi:MAG: hypothetical protein COB19_05830 [Porticoccus sp.]|nr:MAG: hypothetical protein COB19_05830 [Porticoccus sp.]
MQNTFSYITKWLTSLGGEITRVTPSATIISVVASLVAQIALLITFLLPLKILMLVSSQHLPDFLPSPIQAMGLELLVLVLCLLTLSFYFLQIAATKVAEKSSMKGAQKLLDSSNKVLLFDNQKELAKNAYQQFSGLLSCLLFSIISLTALFLFYPEIVMVILVCALLLVNLHTIFGNSEYPFNKLSHVQIAFKVNSSVGASFFIVFIFIVIDFLYLSPPNFLIAFVCFILSRQIIANLGSVVRHIYALTKNHDKITALFFHHHVLEPNTSDTDSTLWQLIETKQYQWVSILLREYLGLNVKEVSVSWLDTRLRNFGFFEVDLNKGEKHLLIKAFDKAALPQATHEEALLQDISSQKLISSPPLLLTDNIAGIRCHIYDLTDILPLNQSEPWAQELETLELLLGLTPSDALGRQYSRSKQTLAERFGTAQLKYLKLVSSQTEQLCIAQFIDEFGELSTILKSLPLWFISSQSNQILAIRSHESLPMVVHWGKWELEPIGAGWPVNGDKLELIKNSIKKASRYRSKLDVNPATFYQLAALTYALEKYLINFRFRKALKIINEINSIMRELKSPSL